MGFFSRRPRHYPIDLARLQSIQRARSGKFDPSDLSPFLWFDADDPTTLNTAADGSGASPGVGDDVRRWVDKARGVVMNAGPTAPTLGTAGVQFAPVSFLQDAAGDTNLLDFMHDGSTGTVWLAATFANDNSRDAISTTTAINATARGHSVFRENGVGTQDYLRMLLGNGSANMFDGEAAYAGDPHLLNSGQERIFGFRAGATTGEQRVVNPTFEGPAVAYSATPAAGASQGPLTFGNRALSPISSLQFVGQLRQLFYFDRLLSDAELDQLTEWMEA
jgi:hypothetical protein